MNPLPHPNGNSRQDALFYIAKVNTILANHPKQQIFKPPTDRTAPNFPGDIDYLFHFFIVLCKSVPTFAYNKNGKFIRRSQDVIEPLFHKIIIELFDTYQNVEFKTQLMFIMFFLVLRINIYYNAKNKDNGNFTPSPSNHVLNATLNSNFLLAAYNQYIIDQVVDNNQLLNYFYDNLNSGLKRFIIKYIYEYGDSIDIEKMTKNGRMYRDIFINQYPDKDGNMVFKFFFEMRTNIVGRLKEEYNVNVQDDDWLL